jgi:hypothetical protein
VKQYSLVVAVAPEPVLRRRMEMEKQVWFEAPTPPGTIVMSGDSGGQVQFRTFAGPGRRGGPALGDIAMRMPLEKMIFFSPNGLFGAGLTSVNEELAQARNLPKGVLVTNVPEGSPAFRSGLRIGDVIITANDDSVTTVGELRDLVIRHFADRSLALQVSRQEKTKKLVLSWASP